jgi:hypothetical protein
MAAVDKSLMVFNRLKFFYRVLGYILLSGKVSTAKITPVNHKIHWGAAWREPLVTFANTAKDVA